MKSMFLSLAVAGLFLSANAQALTLSAGYRGGLAHGSQPSTGAIVNLRIVPKLSVAYSYKYAGINAKTDIEFNSLDDLFTDSDVDIKKAYIRRTFQELQVRLHPKAGSFYLAAGGIKGNGSGHLFVQDKTTSAHLERKYEFESMLYSIGIGNLWDKSSIMVGFDWIGLTRHRAYSYETTETVSEEANSRTSETEDKFLNQLKSKSSSGGLTALLFHLGFAI